MEDFTEKVTSQSEKDCVDKVDRGELCAVSAVRPGVLVESERGEQVRNVRTTGQSHLAATPTTIFGLPSISLF